MTLPYKIILTLLFLGLLSLVSGIEGYTIGKGKVQKEFDLYKSRIEVLSLRQEKQVNEVLDAQRKAQIGAADEYLKRIDAIREYYRVRQQPSGCSSYKVPSLSRNTEQPKETSSYNILAEQCAETTQQVISLQKSWEEQRKIYEEGMK